MVAKYDLKSDSNFDRLYKIRDKWCTALNKDFFSAGILSSQRSESTNNAIGFEAKKSTSLTQFYQIFKRTIARWRKTEIDAEFYCSKTKPTSNFKLVGLLKHASEVYTTSLFRDFEEEFRMAIACTVCQISSQEAGIELYKVSDSEESIQIVKYINHNGLISVLCACRNFDVNWWLCFHCLRILHHYCVNQIPSKYIVPRWTKLAKSEVWARLYEGEIPPPTGNQDPPTKRTTLPWRYDMGRKFYALVLKSQENAESRKIVERLYRTACEAVDKLSIQHETVAEDQQHELSASVQYVMDPNRATTKGRRKRIKGHFEKRNHNSSYQSEFGSKTPNSHIM